MENQIHNPGVCPSWKMDPQPFGVGDDIWGDIPMPEQAVFVVVVVLWFVFLPSSITVLFSYVQFIHLLSTRPRR